MMTDAATLQPQLAAEAVYLGDNGRAFCGRLHCAGSSAHFTGRDLSGQPVLEVGEEEIRLALELGTPVPRCESCGRPAATEEEVERLKKSGAGRVPRPRVSPR